MWFSVRIHLNLAGKATISNVYASACISGSLSSRRVDKQHIKETCGATAVEDFSNPVQLSVFFSEACCGVDCRPLSCTVSKAH